MQNIEDVGMQDRDKTHNTKETEILDREGIRRTKHKGGGNARQRRDKIYNKE